MFHINNMTQMSYNFREQSKIVRTGGIPLWGEGPEPSQATLIASPLPPCLACLPRGEAKSPDNLLPFSGAKESGQGQGRGRGDPRFDIT